MDIAVALIYMLEKLAIKVFQSMENIQFSFASVRKLQETRI